MKKLLQILHIEDSKEDCELTRFRLQTGGLDCDIKRVETRNELFDALQKESFDLILSDHTLPNFSGLHALEIAHALTPEIPFVFVSGTIGEETAIESLRNGATDYVLKNHMNRLVPAVRRALAEAEERKLCRRLQNRMREAGRLEAISTLSNGIAHDFNNILTIIMGHASLLGTENTRPARVQEISDTILEASHRAAEIVEQLMAFARKSDGHALPIDLNHAVHESLGLLKAKVPANIQLWYQPTKDLPNVMADPRQLERILLNLVSNSVESMPDGGIITLSTERGSASNVQDLLPELPDGNFVCLKVTDTGVGMDSVTREHVFEPFFTTKERGRGTGLGLPVVYGLMQAHNGCLKVESEVGEGTSVSLYFPATESKLPPLQLLSPGQDPLLRGSETLLVIEDETDLSSFLEAVLRSHGYKLLIAMNAEQAHQLFRENFDDVHLIFSDVRLPRIDGITLCTELKALKPEVPVIITSGYSSREFQAGLDKLGNVAFLSKPFRPEDVLRLIRKVLNGSRTNKPA
jgi:signal transduction histidine kinase